MASELEEFVQKARERKLSDDEIKQKLLAEGWEAGEVRRALTGESDDLVVPKPPHKQTAANNAAAGLSAGNDPLPISVVSNLSTRGFEYGIMFVSLWAAAFSLGALLHSAVDSLFVNAAPQYGYSGEGNAFFATVLLVFAPIFALLFLRLKKAELATPALRKDSSRRKLSHLTQFVTFLVGMGYIIHFVYSLVSGNSYDGAQSMGELLAHLVVTLVIAGGIFAYYWFDEHKA